MNTGLDSEWMKDYSSPFFAFFGTKQSGNAKEPGSLKQFLISNGKQHNVLIQPKQNHGTTIARIDLHNLSDQPLNTDGLITKLSGVVLSVQTADCVPIIFHDPVNSIIGISHQGWKGTYNNMAGLMITELVDAGADVTKIQCSIGPCIAGESYTVQQDRAELFSTRYPNANSTRVHNGIYYLDLRMVNLYQLKKSGIQENNISLSKEDTYSDTNRYYSYRREFPSLSGQMFHAVVQYHDD